MNSINLGDNTNVIFKVGGADCSIYLGYTKLYPSEEPPTPTGSTCYEVISAPITSYTSTTYDSVYSWSDAKWYMKNNLSQYEEYGIYEVGTSLSDFTYYLDKLVIVGETEYQYQTNGWVEVGEYIEVQTTYEVTDDSTALEGNELPTTFKIPYADVEAAGWLDFRIYTTDGDILNIRTDRYRYMGSESYNGTVTNDSEYYYYSLPSEAPSSVIIEETEYSESTPMHLIFGSKQVSVEYDEKEMPLSKVYNTVADMEATTCPNVGINEYGVVGNDAYQFEESEEWVNKAKSSLKLVAKYNNDNANVIECNSSSELSTGDTQPSYLDNKAMTDAYIGDCVTSIGAQAFWGCSSLTSIDIPSGVTSIANGAFSNCTSLTSCTIGSGVTSIGNTAFYGCSSLTSVTIPNSVTSIGNSAFYDCSSLTSIEIPNSVTSISDNAFGYCTSLTSCTIGSGVTSIGNYAFQYCTSLTSIEIPSGVTSIGKNAFYECSGLTSITVNRTTPPTLGSFVFTNTNNCPIYVPASVVDEYKTSTSTGWNEYASRLQAIP